MINKSKKRNIFKKLIKKIIKGLRRIYWFNFTYLKYFYLSFKFKFSKKKIIKHKISLLLPSRERSKKFERMLKSLIITCKDLKRLELLLLIDTDDKDINEYKQIIKEYENKLKINIFILDLQTHAKRNNYLAKNSSGDLIFPINDDIVFTSYEWDHWLDIEFSKNNFDNPFCVWIDAGNRYRYFHCDFPIVNRKWYEKLGYIGSEYFNFWYLDTWICELSRRSNIFLLTYNIIVKQFSAHSLKNEIDNTYLKNIESGDQGKDDIIWLNTQKQRIIDSKKLI